MSQLTHIHWTDATWNPTTGCTKVSQGCKHCYAERDWHRLSKNPKTVYFGRPFTDVQLHPERLQFPSSLSKPHMIFVDSMSDLFHERIPDHYIRSVFSVMRAVRHHIYQVLTKRHERMLAFAKEQADNFGDWPDHIWLGVSCEDQMAWDERVYSLLNSPAPVKFVSAEPLLGMIDGRGTTSVWNRDTHVTSVPPTADWPIANLQWVIAGGESGPDARPMDPRAVRWLRDQCELAGTPFFFKQWGDWVPPDQVSPLAVQRAKGHTYVGNSEMHGQDIHARASYVVRVGKKLAGNMLDGKQHEAWPR